jgi:hypothetical protein
LIIYKSTDDGGTWQQIAYLLGASDFQFSYPQLLICDSGKEEQLLMFYLHTYVPPGASAIGLFKYTTSGGYVFNTPVVTHYTDTITYFSVCSNLNGDSLLMVYELHEENDATPDVRSIRSTDGGDTWVDDIQADTDGRHPDVAYGMDGYVYLVYGTTAGDDFEIEYRRSINFGSSWQLPARLTDNTVYEDYPKIAALHTRPADFALVWVSFNKEYPADNLDLWCRYSSNSGVNWSASVALATDVDYDEQACDMIVGRTMEDTVVYASYLKYRREPFSEFARIYTIRASVGDPNWNAGDPVRVNDHLAANAPDGRLVCQGTMMLCGADVRPAFLYAGNAFLSGNYEHLYFDGFCSGTDVEEEEGEGLNRPQFSLSNNYPNPFNPETKISYLLPRACRVRLEIFNLLGQRVRTLVDEDHAAGKAEVIWDGKDDEGEAVASGIYFYQIEAGDFVDSKKMVILR